MNSEEMTNIFNVCKEFIVLLITKLLTKIPHPIMHLGVFYAKSKVDSQGALNKSKCDRFFQEILDIKCEKVSKKLTVFIYSCLYIKEFSSESNNCDEISNCNNIFRRVTCQYKT